ncbi:hypothetical protein MMC29_004467 [Sticta canariensis]|nr:hypothetical protein [Sticta canariensis]
MLLNVLVLAALSGTIAAPLPQYDAGSASTSLDGSLNGLDLAGPSSFTDIQSLQPGVLLAQTSSDERENRISNPKEMLSQERIETYIQQAKQRAAELRQQAADRARNPQGPAGQKNTPNEFTTTQPDWEQDFETGLETVLGATGVITVAGWSWKLINGIWTWIKTDDATSGGQGFGGIPFFSNGGL